MSSSLPELARQSTMGVETRGRCEQAARAPAPSWRVSLKAPLPVKSHAA